MDCAHQTEQTLKLIFCSLSNIGYVSKLDEITEWRIIRSFEFASYHGSYFALLVLLYNGYFKRQIHILIIVKIDCAYT